MSERNEHEAQNSAKSIEGWYLTAYALGELDEDSRKVLEAWLTKHPEAHQEIEAIRQTASRVERELTSLPVNLQLDSTRSNKIKEAIASVATAKTPSQINIQSDAIAPNNIRHRRILFAITTGLAAALAGIAFWVNQPHANKSLVSAPANQVPTDSKSIAAKDTASRELFYEEEFVQTERFIDSEKHLAEVSADTSESKLEFRRRGTAGGMGGMGSPGGGAGLPSGGGLSAANIAKDDRLELRMDKKSFRVYRRNHFRPSRSTSIPHRIRSCVSTFWRTMSCHRLVRSESKNGSIILTISILGLLATILLPRT